MNFEQPTVNNFDRERGEKINQVMETSKDLVSSMSAEEKLDFLREIAGNDFEFKIIHHKDDNDKDIGRGISGGPEINPLYRDELGNLKRKDF